MLAGEPPYGGRTLLEVLAKQATEPAPSVCARSARDSSRGLDRAVAAALAAKDRRSGSRARPLSSRRSRLDEAQTARATARIVTPTVVVLPFVNRSADRRQRVLQRRAHRRGDHRFVARLRAARHLAQLGDGV